MSMSVCSFTNSLWKLCLCVVRRQIHIYKIYRLHIKTSANLPAAFPKSQIKCKWKSEAANTQRGVHLIDCKSTNRKPIEWERRVLFGDIKPLNDAFAQIFPHAHDATIIYIYIDHKLD